MTTHILSSLMSSLMLLSAVLFAQTPAPNSVPPPPDVAAPPRDASRTSSGLASKVIKPGSGKTHPSKTDLVTVQYTGWTTDGKMFDSSVVRGAPASFPLDRVIAGWTEGVQLMVAGETRRLWIPEALAYKGQRDPKGMLVFDVELISFVASPAAPPPDVKAAPPNATKTPSGLAYRTLVKGTGTTHPTSRSSVTVNYSGWTTDGKLFDSSVVSGRPATFSLDQVIEGWTEGLQLMVEGEKARFWIPENIAYKGRSAPYGLLVFDVELIKINN